MPYTHATATTGAASVIIEGMTLHSELGFDYSSKHSSLSDKKRELNRAQCLNLEFLIVEEFSMMRSDQLYQVDLRLRELKQNNRKVGGIAKILLGVLRSKENLFYEEILVADNGKSMFLRSKEN